jgi:hypothetical protein
MLVTFRDFVAALKLLIVLILNPERAADVVHAILIRRGIVTARRFVTHGVRILPFRIQIAGGQSWSGFRVALELGLQVIVTASRHPFRGCAGRAPKAFKPLIV